MQPDKSPATHPLEIFFRHNLWANLLLFDACSKLDEAQLAYSAAGVFGSIKETLGHIMYAEERYIFHITAGAQMAGTERLAAASPLGEIRARLAASGEILLQLATSLDGGKRLMVGSGDDAELMPVEALLLQAIHHSTEHRTQIESMFGQLGIDPPGLSGWRYFDEQMKG